MKRFIKVSAIVITLLTVTFVTQGILFARVGPDPATNARPNRIVGLWDVEVTVANCINGQPVASFLALHKYELGGTGQVVPSTNPTALSAHMMVWSHVRGNDYRMALKMFRYDPTGNFIGWTILRNEISISEDANEYVGSGVAEFFNTAGDFVGASCPSFIGTRFSGD